MFTRVVTQKSPDSNKPSSQRETLNRSARTSGKVFLIFWTSSFLYFRSTAVDLCEVYIAELVSSGLCVWKRLSEGLRIVVGFKGIAKEKHHYSHSGTSKPVLSFSCDRLKRGDKFWKSVWVGWYCFCLEEECRGLQSYRHRPFSCFRHKESFKNNLFGSLLGRPAICGRPRPDASIWTSNQNSPKNYGSTK